MIYAFDDFELDDGKVELRRLGVVEPIEPQVFALLRLLVENRERMVSKDEIIEKVWGGRFISDSAVSSRIKFARRALNDDGREQRYIRTVHGQGFRFVAEVETKSGRSRVQYLDERIASIRTDDERAGASTTGRPSIAVLPFRLLGAAEGHTAIAEAIPHELIAALARLRWLFVIARGSSFRFRSGDSDVVQVGFELKVNYCLSGVVEIFGNSLIISVELADTRSGGVIWGERYDVRIDDVHETRARIVASIIAALEIRIPLNEAQLALLSVPENLDAWSAYHLGLQHMYRFNRNDNAAAASLFESAIAKEPGFARAHAGLSFTHFQNAFLSYSDDRDSQIAETRRFAERGIELDPLDPFTNYTMGRTYWLEGTFEGSLAWLDRATMLSPNYAQGFYARALADAVSQRGEDGQKWVETAISLSPLDPLLYAMLATRALNYLVRGNYPESASWADKGARTPGAHVLISLIAAIAHGLNQDPDKASIWAADAHRRRPDMSQAHFFLAFPFAEGPLRRKIAKLLTELGF